MSSASQPSTTEPTPASDDAGVPSLPLPSSNASVDTSSEILSEMFETLLQTASGGDTTNLADNPLSAQTLAEAPLFDGLQDITASLTGGEGLASQLHQEMDGLYTHAPPVLQVQYATDEVKALYTERAANYETDAGWDLHFTEDVTIAPGETKTLDFGVSVAGYTEDGEPTAVWLVPRSSIVKTPLRMANCIGLIDASYRGTLKAVVDNIKTEPYTVKKGDRLFQVAAPTLRPMAWQPVEALTETERGEKGFGSTGK